MTVPVVIHVTADVPAEDVDQLLDEVRALGLDPTLRAVPTRRGVADLVWLVLLALPVKPFLESLAQKFAEDAYAQLTSFVRTALHRQRAPHDGSRVLMLQDTTTPGLKIALEADLPLAAYQQLFGMDPASLPHGTLRYDRSSQEWRTEG